MTTGLLQNTAESPKFEPDWRIPGGYRCHICLIQEEEGDWSAIVLNLPGVGSCAQTKEEALENVREAILGAIESYVADGEDIPWCDVSSSQIPKDAEQRWILVNA
jgi:predicted RNase H-like HicB family nuclease